MKAMYFNDNEFHSNLVETPAGSVCVNMTVRKGVKWSLELKDGDEFAIRQTGTDIWLANAKVWDIKVMPFQSLSVPQYGQLIRCHHLDRGQNYRGLFEAMKRCYDGFLSAEIVTVVLFTITSQSIDGKTAKTESE